MAVSTSIMLPVAVLWFLSSLGGLWLNLEYLKLQSSLQNPGLFSLQDHSSLDVALRASHVKDEAAALTAVSSATPPAYEADPAQAAERGAAAGSDVSSGDVEREQTRSRGGKAVEEMSNLDSERSSVMVAAEVIHDATSKDPTTLFFFLNLSISFLILLAGALKALFLGPLSLVESQKLAERLINFVVFKTLFLTAVMDLAPIKAPSLLWFAMLAVVKMFAGLAHDRFQRLSASPAASAASHARTIALLAVVVAADVACLWWSLSSASRGLSLQVALLFAFEPVIILLDAFQTAILYSLHLAEFYLPPLPGKFFKYLSPFLALGLPPLSEWRSDAQFCLSLALELLSMLLSILHYAHIWSLHGWGLQVIDIVLFLNIRAIAGSLYKKVQKFLRWRKALHSLRCAFPDASVEDLKRLNDDCAICKEEMTSAKLLPCGHIFHLSCLRSWLDQDFGGSYSCPTCRSPLLQPQSSLSSSSSPVAPAAAAAPAAASAGATAAAAAAAAAPQQAAAVPSWPWGFLLQAREGGAGRGQVGVEFEMVRRPAQIFHRRTGMNDESLDQRGFNEMEGAESASEQQTRFFSSERAQGMSASGMRQRRRAAEGEIVGGEGGRLQDGTGEADWMLRWGGRRRNGGDGEDAEARLVAMAAQVEEILPHVPLAVILENLRRTNSVAATVDRLLETW